LNTRAINICRILELLFEVFLSNTAIERLVIIKALFKTCDLELINQDFIKKNSSSNPTFSISIENLKKSKNDIENFKKNNDRYIGVGSTDDIDGIQVTISKKGSSSVKITNKKSEPEIPKSNSFCIIY
jgi:hypothetical protein